MILGTSYRDHRGALVATDKVEKRDGSFFHVETGEELEQAPAKMSEIPQERGEPRRCGGTIRCRYPSCL